MVLPYASMNPLSGKGDTEISWIAHMVYVGQSLLPERLIMNYGFSRIHYLVRVVLLDVVHVLHM